MRHARRLAAAGSVVVLAFAAWGWSYEQPANHGRVILDERSQKAGMEPVQFDHWRHRARYTCRLCHVDVGFAMSAGGTGITAETNKSGFHCGACHNGKTTLAGKPIFSSCGERPVPPETGTCPRCHTRGDSAQRKKDFEAFAAGKPRKGLSGDIDWETAESRGLVLPADQVEGISIPRPPLKMDKDVTLSSQAWMTDVRFSHTKHAVWNGCEVCHPEIFPNRQGAKRYTMLEISSGQSCGVCHGRVAFALGDCERCHVNKVR